eukprot:Seg5612.2 transcript_id=Seg5612.2/GoldUCD/mRNA.D3Y31 product="hypothetical protein" protein_id=Seg5612.2/GoldUCD/D3Y31
MTLAVGKQPILFIGITLVAVSLYAIVYFSGGDIAGVSKQSKRLHSLDGSTAPSPPFIRPHFSFKPRKKRKNLVVKNITIEDGKIFKYYSFNKMEKENDVPVITNKDGCPGKSRPPSSPTEKLQLVTNFLYFKHENYKSNLHYGYGPLTDHVLEARMMEVLDCLQANLLHPFIHRVHVLIREKEAVDFLKRIDFENADKMVIKLTNESVTMKSQLIYASSCLKNSVVAMSHQDNKFGAGWEKLNPQALLSRKIVYALTRQTALNISCAGSKGSANCDPGYPYLGSHDTFVFGVTKGFTPEELKPMESVTPNLYGMENVMIWLFQKLGYKVTNPCPLLHIHHHHCVAVRDGGRKRVNTGGTTGTAPFSYHLD